MKRGYNIFRNCKRILVLGGYGVKNYGDEAILAGIKETIEEQNAKCKMEVFSFNKEEIRKMHNLQGRNFIDLIVRFLTYDTILIGGGTIFRENMRFRAQIIPLCTLISTLFGKRIIFYSLGIDKKTPLLVRFFLVYAMNVADFVSVRENDSKEILKKWGLAKKIHIVPDPAIRLKGVLLSRQEMKNIGIPSKKRYIILSLRYVKRKNDLIFLNGLVEELRNVIKKGYTIVFIPFSKNPYSPFENDLFLGRKIKSLLGENCIILEKEIFPGSLKGLVSEADLVIAMRLHAMIFAVSTKVPLLGISYSQKCSSFLKENGQKVYSLTNPDLSDIESLLRNK